MHGLKNMNNLKSKHNMTLTQCTTNKTMHSANRPRRTPRERGEHNARRAHGTLHNKLNMNGAHTHTHCGDNWNTQSTDNTCIPHISCRRWRMFLAQRASNQSNNPNTETRTTKPATRRNANTQRFQHTQHVIVWAV